MLHFIIIPKSHLWFAILFVLLSFEADVLCRIHKVGDLNGWNIPTTNPELYTKWANYTNINVGDSLFFLYPPSQDSLIEVTGESYKSCNTKNPVLYMNNGNSLFNITRPGNYYFTSGVDGHCGKSQKLHVSVSGNGSYYEAAPAPDPVASGPSYPTNFGSIPPVQSASVSSHSTLIKVPIFLVAATGALMAMFMI